MSDYGELSEFMNGRYSRDEEVMDLQTERDAARAEVARLKGLLAQVHEILNPAQRTYHWLHPKTAHAIGFPQYGDRELAGMVRMLMRDELMHEPICTAARDRIMHLSELVAAARAAITETPAAKDPES